MIDRYLETAKTKKAYTDELFFGAWWKAWFKEQRLNTITPQWIDGARQGLLKEGRTPQRVNRYQIWLRHVLNVAVRDGLLRLQARFSPQSCLKSYCTLVD